jgi:hypothetical protein
MRMTFFDPRFRAVVFGKNYLFRICTLLKKKAVVKYPVVVHWVATLPSFDIIHL